MACHGARRLLAMAANAANVIAIELLAAAQGCDFHAPMRSSEPLERVRALLRARVPHLEDDRLMAPDIAIAAEIVRSGALSEAAGVELPSIAAAASDGPTAGPSPLPLSHSGEGFRESDHDPHTRIDNARIDPRAARARDLREELAHRGAAADADEQPRSRGGREAARARRLRRHRPRRARLGELRPHRRGAARARRRRDAARAVRQAGRRLPHPRRRAARADRQLEPRAGLRDLGALPRARSQGAHDVRPDDGRLVDLHRLAGHRPGHLRDLRRGRPPALRGRPLRALDPHRRARRHGRRAAARRDHGRRLDARRRMLALAHRDAAAHALPRPLDATASTRRWR